MAVNNTTLYIKGEKNVEVTKHDVVLGDILSMECSDTKILPKLKTLKVIKVPEKEKQRFVISVLKIIEIIHKEYPGLEIQNMGETDLIVTYEDQKTPGKFAHFVKASLIVLITFFGAAFSIMSFNNDAGITKLFGQMYEQLMGQTSTGFTVLEYSYCAGLIIGILVFFNHFGKRRFTVDPTPMEVEMRLYEGDIYTTLVEEASRRDEELDVD